MLLSLAENPPTSLGGNKDVNTLANPYAATKSIECVHVTSSNSQIQN